MASAPFRMDPRSMQEEDIADLRAVELARLTRGLPGLGQELREFISRHTPSEGKVVTVPSRIVLIDCFVPVRCPKGWTVAPEEEQIASRFRGEFELTPKSLALYLDSVQEGGGVVGGKALRTALAGTPVLSANVLDYLLEHPELIPKSWKEKVVFFWGTVYHDSRGSLCVRYLYWCGGRWCCLYSRLEGVWDSGRPAAVPASI